MREEVVDVRPRPLERLLRSPRDPHVDVLLRGLGGPGRGQGHDEHRAQRPSCTRAHGMRSFRWANPVPTPGGRPTLSARRSPAQVRAAVRSTPCRKRRGAVTLRAPMRRLGDFQSVVLDLEEEAIDCVVEAVADEEATIRPVSAADASYIPTLGRAAALVFE